MFDEDREVGRRAQCDASSRPGLGDDAVNADALRDVPMDELKALAWKARVEGRQPVFHAVYPGKTLPVSVTGTACALCCSHCGGHYLGGMVDARDIREAVAAKRPRSILLSGGCDLSGSVPLAAALKEAVALRAEEASRDRVLAINVHPGVTSPETARTVGESADVISFDFVLDAEAIREAFHGTWTGRDYVETFRNLRGGNAEVVPHVLIGLRRGRVRGEYDAVDFLLAEGVERLIFIVFIPTPGTAWADVPPPPVEDVSRVLAYARAKGPRTDISLGCMRPAGAYRRCLDISAVECGVDRIVLPYPGAVRRAEALGLAVRRKEECCAFD